MNEVKAEEGLTGPLFQTDVADAKWGFPETLLRGQSKMLLLVVARAQNPHQNCSRLMISAHIDLMIVTYTI
jgi:hypothetical protein